LYGPDSSEFRPTTSVSASSRLARSTSSSGSSGRFDRPYPERVMVASSGVASTYSSRVPGSARAAYSVRSGYTSVTGWSRITSPASCVCGGTGDWGPYRWIVPAGTPPLTGKPLLAGRPVAGSWPAPASCSNQIRAETAGVPCSSIVRQWAAVRKAVSVSRLPVQRWTAAPSASYTTSSPT
jgi:hypothetical protein